MTNINWQDEPQKEVTAQQHRKFSLPAPSSSFWMASSMLLIGIIIGFSVGKFTNGQTALNSSTSTLGPSTETKITPPSLPEGSVRQGRITPPSSASLPPVDLTKDHIRGNLEAQIALVEYSDFECPFCKRVHPTFQKIVEQYGGKVMWVYRHFPLSFHANAQKEAEATECAAEQGENELFWKYTDAIFAETTSNGTGFPLDRFVPLAKALGLDEKKFKSCLDSGKYEKHVLEDMAGGTAAGVTGTPGNFVVDFKTGKNQIVEGAQPLSSFQAVIDTMLQ